MSKTIKLNPEEEGFARKLEIIERKAHYHEEVQILDDTVNQLKDYGLALDREIKNAKKLKLSNLDVERLKYERNNIHLEWNNKSHMLAQRKLDDEAQKQMADEEFDEMRENIDDVMDKLRNILNDIEIAPKIKEMGVYKHLRDALARNAGAIPYAKGKGSDFHKLHDYITAKKAVDDFSKGE